MKPTSEQIAEWLMDAIRMARAEVANGLMASTALAELAFAAGMEAAAQVCEQIGFDLHGTGREDSKAFDFADRIRKAKDES